MTPVLRDPGSGPVALRGSTAWSVLVLTAALGVAACSGASSEPGPGAEGAPASGGEPGGTGSGADAPYDLLVQGGSVVDGTGEPAFRADVAVRGDRIVEVVPEGIDPEDARVVLDAEGLVVTPGFIDHHAHIQEEIFERPLAEAFIRQGITTILASLHSGDQPHPLDERMEALESAPNVGFFAGHNWARRQVMGTADRAPTPEELAAMEDHVRAAMEAGALGLSTGLRYVPGTYSETEEVIALARVAAEHGGIYVSHMRDEGPGVVGSVAELIRIAREADIPAQAQHLKAMGSAQWGLSGRLLAMIDSARAEGLDVSADAYPYTATSTSSAVLFPAWALSGGTDSLRARLERPEDRARIEEGIRRRILTERGGGDLSKIQFSRIPAHPEYEGRTLADLAADRGLPNTVETGVELAPELQLEGGFGGIWHVLDQDDVDAILSHPAVMVCSDGDLVGLGEGNPHPRSYGAFARLLGTYVRERGLLDLPEAVHKMTLQSARQIGQLDRGEIREGAFADLAVFDPGTVRERATFTEPHRFAVGVRHVVVNGVPVLRDGSMTGARPGRPLRGPARPPPGP